MCFLKNQVLTNTFGFNLFYNLDTPHRVSALLSNSISFLDLGCQLFLEIA